ncbi:MAG: ABC transporter permease [Defluviitaleaceae bacterium]|nr:ABC transporter permease [Defluviitaleaceae bacterium]
MRINNHKDTANKPLTTLRIAFNNLCGKPGRAVALVTIVAIMAFVLFGGAILSRGLDNGMRSLEARLGADIIIVPQDSEDDYESLIVDGEPTGFYLDMSVKDYISQMEGVGQVTSQFFLATLGGGSCCTASAQVIGIDYETDFVIMPWVSQLLNRNIGDGEVIVGSGVSINYDNTILLFDVLYPVAARLEHSSTGMDNTIYVSINTMRDMARDAQALGGFPYDVDIDRSVSAILVDVAPGYEINLVARVMRWDIPGISVVESYGIYTNVASGLRFITGVIGTISVVLGVTVIVVLFVLFSLTISGRKKEFAILRILGATRTKLAGIVLTEALDLSLLGAFLGCALSVLVVFPFGRHIGMQMGMPLLLPGVGDSLRLLAIALAVSVAVGPISSAYSAYKISRAETYATMREGE